MAFYEKTAYEKPHRRVESVIPSKMGLHIVDDPLKTAGTQVFSVDRLLGALQRCFPYATTYSRYLI